MSEHTEQARNMESHPAEELSADDDDETGSAPPPESQPDEADTNPDQEASHD
jgi:hypothetical protein